MDYKKRYNKLIETIKVLQKENPSDKVIQNWINENVPELHHESEAEKTERILHSISDKISFHLDDIFTEEEFQCFDAWANAWLDKTRPTKEIINWREIISRNKEDKKNINDLLNIIDECHRYCRYDLKLDDYCTLRDWLKLLEQRIGG